MLTGRYPYFKVRNILELKESVGIKKIDFELINDPQARQVVQSMLEFDPKKRATIDQIRMLPWITEDGKTEV